MENLQCRPTVRQTFHDALLLKDITHFCYSRAWYVPSEWPKTVSVSDCTLQTCNSDPPTELYNFLHCFVTGNVILNANTVFIFFLRF